MIIGNYRSAAACYEKIIEVGPDDITHHEVGNSLKISCENFHVKIFMCDQIIPLVMRLFLKSFDFSSYWNDNLCIKQA